MQRFQRGTYIISVWEYFSHALGLNTVNVAFDCNVSLWVISNLLENAHCCKNLMWRECRLSKRMWPSVSQKSFKVLPEDMWCTKVSLEVFITVFHLWYCYSTATSSQSFILGEVKQRKEAKELCSFLIHCCLIHRMHFTEPLIRHFLWVEKYMYSTWHQSFIFGKGWMYISLEPILQPDVVM